MPIRVDFEPLGRRGECAAGDTVLDAARRTGVTLAAICGGAGSCGRCRVRVQEGEVSPPTSAETKALGADGLRQGMRLACQTRILGDVKVYVPSESLSATQRLQVEGQDVRVALRPPVKAYTVQVPAATLTDLRADVKFF